MDFLRTPEDRFAQLEDFPFRPNYLVNELGLRMHFVDEGAQGRKVALCLHGQPTWSYLYRKMIAPLVANGYRVIAPDLFGFGRSDKPSDQSVYTFEYHRSSLLELVEDLDLSSITLICQDWGGLLGLTMPMEMPDRFEALFVMNTMLGTGDEPLSEGFQAWRNFSNSHPDLDVAALMKRAVPRLTDREAHAYAAPFPELGYKCGVRRFPNLVPEHPNDPGAEISRRARDFLSTRWRGRSVMAIGLQDPVLGKPVMSKLHAVIRNCPPPIELPDAGHFVQEAGAALVQEALKILEE